MRGPGSRREDRCERPFSGSWRRCFFVLGCLSVLLTPGLRGPTPALARWSEEFAPATDILVQNGVIALTEREGQLVIGGSFESIGGRALKGLARWDGRGWLPVGSDFQGIVHALVMWHGRLIAAGESLSSDGRPLGGVAAWDGEAWTSLASGLESAGSLVLWNDLLVAASEKRPLPERKVLVLEHEKWTELGPLPGNGIVITLAVWRGDLYAGTTESRVFRWSGDAWIAAGPAGSETTSSPTTSSATPGSATPAGPAGAVVVGRLVGTSDGLVAHLVPMSARDSVRTAVRLLREPDGKWTTIEETPARATILLGTYRDHALLSDRGGLRVWSGSVWESLAPPFNGAMPAAYDTGTRLWVIGEQHLSNGRMVRPVASLEDGTWTVLAGGLGLDESVSALGSQGNDLVVAGWFARCGLVPAARAALWNNGQWRPLHEARRGKTDSTECRPTRIDEVLRWDGALVACGVFSSAGTPRGRQVLAARWDGQMWRPVGGAVAEGSSGGRSSGGVHARSAAATPAGLVVAGNPWSSNGDVFPGLGLWDRSSWRSLGHEVGCAPVPQCVEQFTRVVPFEAGVVAAGALHDSIGPRPVGYWSGSSWSFMGGVTGRVDDLTVSSGKVVASGSFVLPGENSARSVAAWDGKSWTALGDGPPGPVVRLGTFGDRVLAAVSVPGPGTAAASALWSWNGQEWSPFEGGANFNGEVRALCEHQGYLYVGGEFGAVNDVVSAYIARWIPDDRSGH